MKRIAREYFIAFALSWEAFVLFIGIFMYWFFSEQLGLVVSKLQHEKDLIKYLVLLPSAIAVWVSKESHALLFPEENSRARLQEWSEYWRLRIYFNVGLVYAWIFAILGFLVWLIGLEINQLKGFVLLLVSLVGIFVVVSSVYFAKINQKEVLSRLR